METTSSKRLCTDAGKLDWVLDPMLVELIACIRRVIVAISCGFVDMLSSNSKSSKDWIYQLLIYLQLVICFVKLNLVSLNFISFFYLNYVPRLTEFQYFIPIKIALLMQWDE
jgi:hypothetical protein